MALNIDNTSTVKLQKLQPGEYTKWSRNMCFVLSGHGLYDYITDDAPVVPKPETPADYAGDNDALERKLKRYREYTREKQKATYLIRVALTDDMQQTYSDPDYLRNPKKLWDDIKESQQEMTRYAEDYLRDELYNIKLEDHGSIDKYMSKLRDLFDKVSLGGDFEITAQERYFYILHGLPKKDNWDIQKQLIKRSLVPNRTEWTKLQTHLETYEADLKREKGLSNDKMLYAGKGRFRRGQRNDYQNRENGKTYDKRKNKIESFDDCSKRGHRGHSKDTCFWNPAYKGKKPPTE